MIDVIFQQQQELVAVRIMGKNLLFLPQVRGQFPKYAPISGLKLDIGGILKEFPDLKDKEPAEIRRIAIQRFKDKIKTMETEQEIKEYVIKDLVGKHGFKFVGTQRKGFRFQKGK